VWRELKEEIELEFSQLRRQMQDLSDLRAKVASVPPDQVEVMALATFLQAFYNGLENSLKRIAIHIDGEPPAGPHSHSELLDRMSRPFKIRPAVVSQDSRERLRLYMDFRHLFRHAYSFELRWTKMAPLVHEAEATMCELEDEINRFLEAYRNDVQS